MIHAPAPNEWGLIIPSVPDGSQPGSIGAIVTPGENALGSYASLIAGASVTHDVYEILICIHANNAVATARDALLTIGIDPAGGSSFVPLINHLSCAMASPMTGINGGGNGVWYRFPLFIRAGTSIGAAASVNNATVGTMRCLVVLSCKPSRRPWAGSAVQTFGAALASSSGTETITVGVAAEGAWVEVGTLDRPIWFLDFGLGYNNGVVTTRGLFVDVALGDATNKKIVVANAVVCVSGNELLGKGPSGQYCRGAIGDKIYMRVQASGGSDTGLTALAYGVA